MKHPTLVIAVPLTVLTLSLAAAPAVAANPGPPPGSGGSATGSAKSTHCGKSREWVKVASGRLGNLKAAEYVAVYKGKVVACGTTKEVVSSAKTTVKINAYRSWAGKVVKKGKRSTSQYTVLGAGQCVAMNYYLINKNGKVVKKLRGLELCSS